MPTQIELLARIAMLEVALAALARQVQLLERSRQ